VLFGDLGLGELECGGVADEADVLLYGIQSLREGQ
jgi:hypothetical protein